MVKANVKIEDYRHTKIKELAAKNNRTIQEEYAEAIDNHLAGKYQEIILADSKLEELVTKRMTKMEDRLAAMIAKSGIDTSIVLMATTYFLSKELDIDRNEIYKIFRGEGNNYYSNSKQKSKS